MNHCRDMHQGINFSELKSYHQNGISDFFIRSLQDLERCKIIHAHHQYPSAVTAKPVALHSQECVQHHQ